MLEFEEPEPIEASHLVSTQCRDCGSKALSVPERARKARCGTCAHSAAGAGTAVVGKPGPVVRYGTFALPIPEEVREVYPHPTYVGPVGKVSPVLVVAGDGDALREDTEFMQCPQPVMSLAEYARENSWEVRCQYTRGRLPHGSTGHPGAEKHVISLRFGGHPMTDRQAYAVYARAVSGGTWAWQSVAVWGPALPPYLGCGITELRTYLGEGATFHDAGMLKWIGERKAELANGEAARKQREVARREIRKAFADGMSVAMLAAQYSMTEDEVTAIVNKSSGKRKEGAS